MKKGDKVRIINRLPSNTTGGEDYDKPNGDVGKEGIIHGDISNGHYQINNSYNGTYLGWFKPEIEIILINQEISYEIY